MGFFVTNWLSLALQWLQSTGSLRSTSEQCDLFNCLFKSVPYYWCSIFSLLADLPLLFSLLFKSGMMSLLLYGFLVNMSTLLSKFYNIWIEITWIHSLFFVLCFLWGGLKTLIYFQPNLLLSLNLQNKNNSMAEHQTFR